MIRIRIPRDPLRRIVTALAVAGCAVLLAAALAGCGGAETGAIPAAMIPPHGPARSGHAGAERPDRGTLWEFRPRVGVTCWAWKHGHGAALSCLPDEPTRFRPDYHPPAEAPEGEGYENR